MWYIAHHGILGQKHGVRNGPPYPLGSGDHSASEKKAGWRKSLVDNRKTRKWQNADGSLTKKGSKVFERVVEISNEEGKAKARYSQASKELADYEKKHINKKQYRNADIDEVELARKKLRDNDIKYNELIQQSAKTGQEWFNLSISLDQELKSIADKRTSVFTTIGQDRAKKILNDYKKYQSTKILKQKK